MRERHQCDVLAIVAVSQGIYTMSRLLLPPLTTAGRTGLLLSSGMCVWGMHSANVEWCCRLADMCSISSRLVETGGAEAGWSGRVGSGEALIWHGSRVPGMIGSVQIPDRVDPIGRSLAQAYTHPGGPTAATRPSGSVRPCGARTPVSGAGGARRAHACARVQIAVRPMCGAIGPGCRVYPVSCVTAAV